MITVARKYTWEGAHCLPKTPKSHKCHTMHGHSYLLEVELEGEIDQAMGWFIDFADIDAVVREEVIVVLDHRTMNEIAGLEIGTLEVLAPWIWNRLYTALNASPNFTRWMDSKQNATLSRVVIHEGPHSRVEYSGR